ncbi:MAG: hypothetical protein Q9187_006286 [Circinaria calcarea]
MDSRGETVTLQYLTWTNLYLREKPFQLFLELPPDAPDQRKTNLTFEKKEVVVRNIREHGSEFALDTHGFMARRLSVTPDLEKLDASNMESAYLPKIERLVKSEVEGVDRVFFYDWRFRSASDSTAKKETLDLKDLSDKLLPANFAHIDASPVSAIKLVQKHLADEAEYLLQGRVRILKFAL